MHYTSIILYYYVILVSIIMSLDIKILVLLDVLGHFKIKKMIIFQYKNTFTEDLWAALEEASNKPVGAVMSTWTKQMGFPVVQVI